VYLFARQAFLLTALEKHVDICSRATDYIATLARTLRNDQEDAGISFIESWIFSSAMQIIEATRKAPKSHAMASATGDLLFIARNQVISVCSFINFQLDKLGRHLKLIPPTVPFESSFEEVPLDADATMVDSFKTTNPILSEAVKDESKFRELYEVSHLMFRG
jgi:trafficking protein particle complex subunit 10